MQIALVTITYEVDRLFGQYNGNCLFEGFCGMRAFESRSARQADTAIFSRSISMGWSHKPPLNRLPPQEPSKNLVISG